MTMSLCEGGKLRLLRPGVLEHFCPGCDEVHAIDIHAQGLHGHVVGWDGDPHNPTFGEAIAHETAKGRCEYILRGGVLYFLESCSHELAGKSRHLPEFPR